jgi:SAM-dependent methyltransferase
VGRVAAQRDYQHSRGTRIRTGTVGFRGAAWQDGLMDGKTVRAYDAAAGAFADAWEAQLTPLDVYALVERFFAPGPTVDVGCGAGRDTAWLVEHGYPATGVDPSAKLLAQARHRHPGIAFIQGSLPDLPGVPGAHFANVFCETVIMHLDRTEIANAGRSLVELLAPGGTIYLSWRSTLGLDKRDSTGRLYTALDRSQVLATLANTTLLHEAESVSTSSGALVHRLVARRTSSRRRSPVT